MRRIKKSSEPRELLEYRLSSDPNKSYDNFRDKGALREATAKDQGFLCAYCMARIRPESLRIEHHRSRALHPDQTLSWTNLVACCHGNRGSPPSEQTCDVRKGERDIELSPLDESVRTITCLLSGRVESSRSTYQCEIDEVLNLNLPRLQQQRREAVEGAREGLSKRLGNDSPWTKGQLQRELDRVRSLSELPEFLGAVEAFVEHLIRRRQK